MMSRSIGENLKKIYFFFNYLPLQIWTTKICNYDISKSITKLGQLIEDDEEIALVKIKKKVCVFFRMIAICRFGP